jgi:hypothetical protein
VREVRGDCTLGEQIMDIADNVSDDWSFNPDSVSSPQAAGAAALTVHLHQPRPAKSLYFRTPDRALRSL